jgi:hypothetical protein
MKKEKRDKRGADGGMLRSLKRNDDRLEFVEDGVDVLQQRKVVDGHTVGRRNDGGYGRLQ